MKKVILVVLVLLILVGGTICYANGPWPEPAETTVITEEATS